MVRTTRNSQRAAAHAVPPSASRPGSPYDFNTNPVPFPSLDALDDLEDQHPNQINIFEQQDRELLATGCRRSTRQALKVFPNAPAAPPVAVTASNSNKDPSPAPFRRSPTGSKAKRHVLGDLMDPPPPEPTPSVASDELNNENDEIAVPTAASHLAPVPYNAKYRNVEPRDVRDLFWENRCHPVHRAQRRRPTKWEDVEYYQENEWDTDDDEYTPRPPRPRRPSSKRMPKIDRDQRVLFEGVSFMRNAPSMAKKWSNFKLVGSKNIKGRLAFPALREGGKLKLVASNGRGHHWRGVKTPQKPNDSGSASPQAKVYALPQGDGVDFDENGDPLPNPDIHPSTDLPTAEWLADNVDELAQEAKRAEEELEKVKQKQAYSWGKLMIENEDLAEDEKAVEELMERVKNIIPPDVFKTMARSLYIDMDDPENRFGPAKESPFDAYLEHLEALATQRQPTPPPRPVIASTARATSNKENTGPKPKPLTRTTYQQKLAMAKALTKLQDPSADTKTKTRRKPKPRARASNVKKNDDDDTEVEDEDGTDAEWDDEEDDTAEGSEESSDGEADEKENKPRAAATQVHMEPSSPQSEKSDSEDAGDENESLVQAKKRVDRDNQVPDNDDDSGAFDDFYSDEEKTWNPTRAELQAQSHNVSEDEDDADDLGPAVKKAEEHPVKATASKTASTFVIWKDGDASPTREGAENKASAPKRAPLGPKGMPSAMPSRNLKRYRDESDDEDSEGGDEENDENKDSRVPSKKRRVSGYYGANDENASYAPASQAESDSNKTYEDNQSSVNRLLSPIYERPSSEERETEEIEELLSFIQNSPAGSPEPIGDTSVSVHLNDNDVEMSDESDEEQNDENAAPAPAATFAPAPAVAPLLPAPVIAPLLPSPVIVSSARARRPRSLRRDVVTVVGNRQIIYGQVFEDGKEV